MVRQRARQVRQGAFFQALSSNSGGCRGKAKQRPKCRPLLFLLLPLLPPNGPDSFRDSLGKGSQTIDESCLSSAHANTVYTETCPPSCGTHPLSNVRTVSRGHWSQEEFFCQTLMREPLLSIEVKGDHHDILLSLMPTQKVPQRDDQIAVSSRGPRFVYSAPEESMYIPKHRLFAAWKALLNRIGVQRRKISSAEVHRSLHPLRQFIHSNLPRISKDMLTLLLKNQDFRTSASPCAAATVDTQLTA